MERVRASRQNMEQIRTCSPAATSVTLVDTASQHSNSGLLDEIFGAIEEELAPESCCGNDGDDNDEEEEEEAVNFAHASSLAGAPPKVGFSVLDHPTPSEVDEYENGYFAEEDSLSRADLILSIESIESIESLESVEEIRPWQELCTEKFHPKNPNWVPASTRPSTPPPPMPTGNYYPGAAPGNDFWPVHRKKSKRVSGVTRIIEIVKRSTLICAFNRAQKRFTKRW